MTTLELPGRITENGHLEIELPEGLPAGKVTVRIDMPDAVVNWDDQPWTEDELQELLTPHPKTGAEIALMLRQMPPIELLDPEISDPTEWLKHQRSKQAARLKPFWDDVQ